MWECPKCKESMHDYDEFCWSCKTRNPYIPGNKTQESGEKSKAAEDTPKIPEKKKCPFCAEEIRIEAIKCRFCGSVMPETKTKEEPEVKKSAVSIGNPQDEIRIPKKAAMRFLIAVLAVAGLIVLSKIIFDSVFHNKAGGRGDRRGGYEEVIEYDRSGKIVNSTKNYNNSK